MYVMKSDLGMPWTIVFACLHLLFCRKYSIYIVEVGRWGRIGRTVRIMGRMRLRAMMTAAAAESACEAVAFGAAASSP